jgi:hypothetical protein
LGLFLREPNAEEAMLMRCDECGKPLDPDDALTFNNPLTDEPIFVHCECWNSVLNEEADKLADQADQRENTDYYR